MLWRGTTRWVFILEKKTRLLPKLGTATTITPAPPPPNILIPLTNLQLRTRHRLHPSVQVLSIMASRIHHLLPHRNILRPHPRARFSFNSSLSMSKTLLTANGTVLLGILMLQFQTSRQYPF